MKSKGFISVLVVVGIGLLIYLFRADDDPPEIPREPREMGLAETGQAPAEREEVSPSQPLSSAEPRPSVSVEDSLLTSENDREAWMNCVGGEIPRETDNLEEWAQGQSAEPPTVHWSNAHFRDSQGQELRVRFLIDDGPDENPIPRLQLFSVDEEGNPGDILRQEDMEFETARDVMVTWMGGETPYYQEKSMSFYFEDGEATLETENNRTRSLTITQGSAVLVCSLRGTAPGHRCTCRGAAINEDTDPSYPEED